MSDTPRTDALWLTEANSEKAWYRVAEEMRDHSRNLERELAAVTRELNAVNQIAKKYEDRYFASLECIKRLEEELAAMTGERDEALKDLEFRRGLFELQTQTLAEVIVVRDEVRKQRDILEKALVDITNEYYGGEAAIAYEALAALKGKKHE